MNRTERVELAAYRLSDILYPQGQWGGVARIFYDNKTRDEFCHAAAVLRAALQSTNAEGSLDDAFMQRV